MAKGGFMMSSACHPWIFRLLFSNYRISYIVVIIV
jgi:hypothetical protein